MDDNEWLAAALRGATAAAARRGLPDARLARRGRRRPAGRLAARQPRGRERGREPRRLADDDRRPRLPEHAAVPRPATRGAASAPACRIRSSARDRGARARGAGAAGGLGRPRAPRRARHADPGGAPGVRAPRHVRAPVRRDRAVVGRSPVAARQLASRARRRVRGAEIPEPDPDLARQREVVDAFFRAARGGDFDAPHRGARSRRGARASDFGARRPAGTSPVIRGAAAVARQARGFPGALVRPALVNGAAGVVITARGRPIVVMGFTVVDGRIVEIDAIADSRAGRPRRRIGLRRGVSRHRLLGTASATRPMVRACCGGRPPPSS